MGPPEGYSQGQVREGMSIPGRIRFTNRTDTKAIVTKCSGYSNGSYPALAWSGEPCTGSVQTGVMEIPPEYESTWIKFSLGLPRIDKLFVTIYVGNLNSTGPNVNTRDVHFVFHDTSGETALYDHYKDKKHFEVKVETSNNETHWILDWKDKAAFDKIDWSADERWKPYSSVETLALGASVLPVYDTVGGHARMFFGPKGVDNANPDGIPIRVLQLDDYGLEVSFRRVTWPAPIIDRLGDTVKVVLQGYFQPHDSNAPESEPCTGDVPLELSFSQSSSRTQIQLKPARQYLPWGLRGRICWSLLLSDFDNHRMQIGESPVELYFVASAQLPEFLYRGIPVGLFRKFLLPLRLMSEDDDIGKFNDDASERRIGDDENGWLVYVTEKLHFQKNIWYDSLHGGSWHYFSGGAAPLHLDHWVDDCAEKEKHTINCYDLAGLTHAIVPLGLRSADRYLQMKRMQPFGYIKKAQLIGRGVSNSPMSNGTPVVFFREENDVRRTAFGTHVFMTIAERKGAAEMVMDATCRPLSGGPHAGRETLAEYIKNSIDHTTELYHVPDSDLKEAGISPKRLGVLREGKYPNPVNWVGVNKLATQPEIFFPELRHDSAGAEDNVLANVDEIFAGWDACDPNFVVNSNNLSATWCMMKDGECLNLRISRCTLEADARELYAQAKDRLTQPGQGTILTDEYEEAPKDIQVAWKNKHVDRSHLAVSTDNSGVILWTQGPLFVMITKDSRDDLAEYVKKLQDLISNLKAPEPPALKVEGESAGEIPRTYRVGETFDIKVSNLPEEMIPLNVDIEKTKVLYLSSSKAGDTATFKFLARARTDKNDTIKFSRFDANMKYWQAAATVSVEIV